MEIKAKINSKEWVKNSHYFATFSNRVYLFFILYACVSLTAEIFSQLDLYYSLSILLVVGRNTN